MKTDKMIISFGGESHQIDANTLIDTLIHYSSIINAANEELSGGARNVQVNINALKQGSFIIEVSLSETIRSLFSLNTVEYLAGIITIAGHVFGFYKKLKGEKIKDPNSVQINIKGDKNNISVQNIINVYNSPQVREAISKSIESADNDENVQSITIEGEYTEPVIINKEEFGRLIYNDFDKENDVVEKEIEEDVDARLVIKGLNFQKDKMWSFLYNGFNIKIRVKDDALMHEIDNGEQFGKGDAIRVKMKILKRYNPIYHAYENSSYKIIEFYELIKCNKNLGIKML